MFLRRHAWLVVLLIATVATGGYFLMPSVTTHDVYYDAFGLIASLLILGGVWLNRPARRAPWVLFAAGLFTFTVGDMMWTYYEVVRETAPWPSAADVFYLAGYPLFCAGLMMLIRSRRIRGRDRGALIDAIIVTTSLGVLSWIFLIAPYANDPSLSLLERVVSVAYPLMDVLLLAVAVRLMFSPGAREPSYIFLMAGLVSYLVADAVYTLLAYEGTYVTGHAVDAGWLAAAAVFAAAALHPSMRDLSEPVPDREVRLTRRRIALLTAAALLTPTALVVPSIHGNPTDVVLLAVASATTFVLVVVRMIGLIREVETSAGIIHQQREQILAEQRVSAELRRLGEMKSEFVSVASHELRTPLTSILGYGKTLQQPAVAEDPATREECAGGIVRQGERLLRLIENLMTASHLEDGRLHPTMTETSFADVCGEAIAGLGEASDRVRLLLPPDLPPLISDPDLLGRVLANLLDNALRYSSVPSPCEIGARCDADRFVFWVADRGVGIPPEDLERIFERFYQGDSSATRTHGGVGLGLNLVRDIASALGGVVEVESEVGRGSTFTVRLPVAAEEVAPAVADETTNGLDDALLEASLSDEARAWLQQTRNGTREPV
jgi:signal transduction histidine kinase